jgi:serine/threonine-protein kinase
LATRTSSTSPTSGCSPTARPTSSWSTSTGRRWGRGLNGAHDKGIVHRDLKPENIFILERDGQKDFVKIVDFGIAKDITHKKKLTQAGMVLGTPEYMSPEQATGQPLDHRVDQYALGCILYEMLTGEVPFRSDTPTKTLTQHVFDKVTPPSERRPDLAIPPPLEAIVMRAMQKKPPDRFANLKEVIAALEKVEKELKPKTGARPAVRAALASPTPDTETALAAVHGPARRRMLVLGGGVVVMLAGVAVVIATSGGKPKPLLPPPVVAQPAPPAPVVSPLPPGPAMPGDVDIVLRTTPSGAEVMEGTQRLGVAPLHLKRMRSSQTIRLVLRRPGYREETREISLNADKDIEVVLMAKESKVATRGKPATHSAPVAAPKPQPSQPPPKTRVSDLRNPFD